MAKREYAAYRRRLDMNWDEAHLQGDLEAMQQAREEAIVRAALERAAEKAVNKLELKRLYTEAQSVSDAIRYLASDPAEVAEIIKKAAEVV
jgi:hypothetical protein